MPFFPLDFRKLVLAAFAVLLPLIYFDYESKKDTAPWYTVPFSITGSLIQSSYAWLDDSVRDTIGLYANLIDIKTQNRELAAKIQAQETQLATFNELKQENVRLRGLLDFSQSSEMELIPARVIGGPLLSEHFTLTINKGSTHGVKKGQGVMSTKGVIGYVLRADLASSLVLLLTDRYAVVDALVQQTRARGIVEGLGPGKATLRYLERMEDVNVGDLVVTNGLDNIFPKGFPIAEVTAVDKANYGISVEVDLRPVVTLSAVEEVFVVQNANRKNYLEEESQ